MIELFETALKSPAGSFAFVLSFLAVTYLVIWKVSHFTTKFNSVEKMENAIESIKGDIHSIKASIQYNSDLIKLNSDSIKLVSDSIKSITDLNNPFAQRQSPVSMTDKGKEVSDEIKLNEIIATHWEKINTQLNDILNSDCNPYDIQVESFKIGEQYQHFLSSEELKAVKNHAFKSGFNLEVYNLLFGIAIRDKYLSIKGIDKSDIDLYDPISKSKNS
jgi:hypothetical protein